MAGEALRLRLRDTLGRREAAQPDRAHPLARRRRQEPHDDPVDPGELEPVSQRRAHHVRPDGKLYAIVGDGHDAGNAQDLTKNLRGKMLRLNPDGSVPATNPTIGGARTRIFAFGIRNSFRVRVRSPGRQALGDGERTRVQRRDQPHAARWELRLGPERGCPDTNRDGPAPRRLPKVNFASTIGITGRRSATGAASARRATATCSSGHCCGGGILRRLTLNPMRTDVVGGPIGVLHSPGGAIHSMEVGPSGSIYFSDRSGVYRLVRR